MRSRALLLMFVGLASLGVQGCGSFKGSSRDDTFAARKRLTRELVARQDWTGAFFYADQLHREKPRDAETLVLRGIVYRERGLPGEAEADLREAMRLDGSLAEAHAALAMLYDQTSRGLLAESSHRRATELSPDNAGYLNNMGFSLFLLGKSKEAVEVFKRAARLSPTSPRIRVNLGFAYAAAGDLPRAAKEFDMGGTPAEAKNNLGFAYERRGDLARAFELYLQALRLDPKLVRAKVNLAHVAGRLGKEIPEDVTVEVNKPTERSEGQ